VKMVWPGVCKIITVAALMAGAGVVIGARAETIQLGPHSCEVEWDQSVFWITCDLEGDGLIAPESEAFWNRTSVEVYLGESGRPFKFFCDSEGRVKTDGDMVYPVDAVVCSADENRIETGLLWTASPYEPGIGTVVHYGLKVNAMDASGKLPSYKTPEGLRNDPGMFDALTLTANNLRGMKPPGTPWIPEVGLMLAWDESATTDGSPVDHYNVHIDDSPPITAPTNKLRLQPYLKDGSHRYKFQVSAVAGAEVSGLSDPLHEWVGLYVEPCEPIACPPVECPQCPEVPAPAECPHIEACPEDVLPQVQQITVKCAP